MCGKWLGEDSADQIGTLHGERPARSFADDMNTLRATTVSTDVLYQHLPLSPGHDGPSKARPLSTACAVLVGYPLEGSWLGVSSHVPWPRNQCSIRCSTFMAHAALVA
jgi:hypothetical protein